jgi:hypothetical protein
LLRFHQAIDAAVSPIELAHIADLGQSLRHLKNGFAAAVEGTGELAALI